MTHTMNVYSTHTHTIYMLLDVYQSREVKVYYLSFFITITTIIIFYIQDKTTKRTI